MVRRGFPAEADRLAAAVRAELGLGVYDPLDPGLLAENYGVPICSLSDLVAEGADAVVH
jgi:hypothetical protein